MLIFRKFRRNCVGKWVSKSWELGLLCQGRVALKRLLFYNSLGESPAKFGGFATEYPLAVLAESLDELYMKCMKYINSEEIVEKEITRVREWFPNNDETSSERNLQNPKLRKKKCSETRLK